MSANPRLGFCCKFIPEDGDAEEAQPVQEHAPAAGDVVISQVYGGGGNMGAPYSADFVELFNRGKFVYTRGELAEVQQGLERLRTTSSWCLRALGIR